MEPPHDDTPSETPSALRRVLDDVLELNHAETSPAGNGSLDDTLVAPGARGRRLEALAEALAEDSAAVEEPIGRVLHDRYRVTKKLGAGGMGAVYEAEHLALRSRVAIKILLAPFADDPSAKKRFSREARAARAIESENVVRITDFGVTDDGLAYLVMDYLEGQDLRAWLDARGSVPWEETRGIVLQIAAALRAAHAQGIIHRDIKPGNCFLLDRSSGPPLVKVLDFGLAKAHSSTAPAQVADGSVTATHDIVGTPAYMAPEAAERQASPQSDIYSLGVLMFRMLTGVLPFSGPTPLRMLSQHLTQPPPRLRELEPRVPADVERIVLRMLDKDPDARFQSIDELAAAIREVSERGAGSAHGSRRRWGAVAVVGLLLGVVGAVAVARSGPRDEDGTDRASAVGRSFLPDRAPDAPPPLVSSESTGLGIGSSGATTGGQSTGSGGSSGELPGATGDPPAPSDPPPRRKRRSPKKALEAAIAKRCRSVTGPVQVTGWVGLDGRFTRIESITGGEPRDRACISKAAREIDFGRGERRREEVRVVVGRGK